MDSEQLLNEAVVSGDLTVLRWLADRASMKFKRASPLIAAVQCQRPAMVTLLLEKKANPFKRVDGTTAFHVACSIGTPSQVRAMLLLPTVAVNCTDTIGRTGLHLAVMDNNVHVVQHILQCKHLRVNACDMFGKTALMYACKANAVTVVHALLARKARNDIATTDGRYPIHFAANRPDVLRVLPPDHANHADAYGRRPLDYAAMFKHLEAMKYLISIGAVVENATDLLGLLLRASKKPFPPDIAHAAFWLVETYGASHRTLVRLAYSKAILPIIKRLAPKGVVAPMCTVGNNADELARSHLIHYLTCQGVIDLGHLELPSLRLTSYALLAELLQASLLRGNLLVRIFTVRKRRKRRRAVLLNLDVLEHVAEFLEVVVAKVRWQVLKKMLDWTSVTPEAVDVRY